MLKRNGKLKIESGPEDEIVCFTTYEKVSIILRIIIGIMFTPILIGLFILVEAIRDYLVLRSECQKTKSVIRALKVDEPGAGAG